MTSKSRPRGMDLAKTNHMQSPSRCHTQYGRGCVRPYMLRATGIGPKIGLSRLPPIGKYGVFETSLWRLTFLCRAVLVECRLFIVLSRR